MGNLLLATVSVMAMALTPAPTALTGHSVETARPSGHSVELEYVAPTECPDRAYVLERVASMVHRVPPNPVVARATITRESNYRLELAIEGGLRTVSAESCRAVVETLTVIVALAVDPDARVKPDKAEHGTDPDAAPSAPGDTSGAAPASQPGTAPASQPGTAPASQPGTDPASQPGTDPASQPGTAPTTPPTRSAASSLTTSATSNSVPASDQQKTRSSQPESSTAIRWSPLLLGWAEYGMLPHASAGAQLGLRFGRGAWSLQMLLEGLWPRWAQDPTSANRRGGNISFVGGQFAGCRRFTVHPVLHFCAGVESGDMMGKGSGASTAKLGHGLWLAGNGGFAFEMPIRAQLGAVVELGLALPIYRPAFGIDGNTWEIAPKPWSLRLAVGVSWESFTD